jgi:hypothetical protein
MKTQYPVEWGPVTPEYVLAGIQEEWRQCAENEGEVKAPNFSTTVQEWRKAMDLIWWSPLGAALNKRWGTKFPGRQWFRVLVPAADRTLRDVCNLVATQMRQPVFPEPHFLGGRCPGAGVFLAIRSLLIQAGASPDLRPSTPIEPFLRKWPKVFVQKIARLAPDSLPLYFKHKVLAWLPFPSLLVGWGLILAGGKAEPWWVVSGVVLVAFGWFGGMFGGTWFRGRLTLEGVNTFRDLTKLIVEQVRRRPGSSIASRVAEHRN